MTQSLDTTAVLTIVRTAPVWAEGDVIGRPGIPVPDLDEPKSYDVDSKDDRDALKSFGITILLTGRRNRVILDNAATPKHISIEFTNGENNTIILSARARLASKIRVEGNANILYSGSHVLRNETNFVFRGDESFIYYGKDSSSNGLELFVEGPRRFIVISEDCMFAYGAKVRTSDSHGVFDIKSGSILNAPRSILIGAHVWAGMSALVLKGAFVGAGAVLGAQTIVSGFVPPCVSVVGVTHRVAREDISWTRSIYPQRSEIDEVTQRLARYDNSGLRDLFKAIVG